MSSIAAPELTYCNSIPLYRRISEIMKEKGGYYSQQAMAKRLGMSRETLRLMLAGKREIYWFELEKLAHDLKLPLSRITQEDVRNDYDELYRLFETLEDNDKAIVLANQLVERAIGDSERCDAITLLGRALFEVKEYDRAHECRLKAYSLAERLYEKYQDEERLYETLKFLMTSFTIRKDFSSANEIVKKVEDACQSDPIRYAALCYTLAMMAYDSGNLALTKERLIESLESYRKTDNVKEIGRAEHSVGFIEYKLGNLLESKRMFEKSIATLSDFREAKLTATKDYIKVLIKLGDYGLASDYISRSLEELAETASLSDLAMKFKLLGSICNDDPNTALSILATNNAPHDFKVLACKILLAHFSRKDDAYSLMKYYKVLEGLTLKKSDVLGEGDL